MDDTETLTPPESPPVVDEGTPASQDVVTPPSEPEPLVEAEVTEETPPAWANVQEAEDVLELEDMKPLLERRDKSAGDRAYELLKGHMQPRLVERSQAAARAAQGIEAINTTLARAQEDGVLDKRVIEDVFRTHRQELAGFTGEASTTGWYQGVEQYLTFLLGTDAPPFVTRLQRMRDESYPDDTFAADTKKKIVAAARQEGHEEGFKKGLKEGKNAGSAQTAIKANKDKGANLAPGTPAGGKPDLNKARRDYSDGTITTAQAKELGVPEAGG